MTLATAIAAEREGRIQQAASEYESILGSTPPDLEAFINLLVLYWQCTDYGFSIAHELPPMFVALAGRRLRELSDQTLAQFPNAPEVRFWIPYIRWADLGEGLSADQCRELRTWYPEYLEPTAFLFAASGGTESEEESQELLRRCKDTGTIRCQYLASVIEGAIRRKQARN